MSVERFCGDSDVLMSYLYDEGDQATRQAFEAHLASCAACAREVDGLRGVRSGLAAWTPPETVLDFQIVRRPAAAPARRPAWFAIPALPVWAQFAAASLVVGVAVGISGLEVRYDASGMTVRAGWTKPAAVPVQVQAAADGKAVPAAAVPAPRQAGVQRAGSAAAADEAPWRAEFAALEQRVMQQARQQNGAGARQASLGAGPAMSDDAYLAKVRELISASESRQQRELAMRLTQVVRDFDTQRRGDLARVANGFGALEGRTGAAVAQQRELLNYLVRVSQTQK